MEKIKAAIKSKGYSITGFCEHVLEIPYNTFKHQVDNKTLRWKDIDKMLDVLGMKYEELFR